MELIERNPFQPRREFEPAAIDELAESIRKHGILQPLLVRARTDGEAGYQLIAGERRWRAAQQVGMETVPCRVIQFEDRQACEAALEENLKREDLNVLEKAAAFKDYLERFGGTIEELGRQLSMNRATVSNMMRLLELPESIQQLLRSNKITGGHAKALLPLSEAQQNELARQIEQEQLSVRRVEEIAREMLRSGTLPLPQARTQLQRRNKRTAEQQPGHIKSCAWTAGFSARPSRGEDRHSTEEKQCRPDRDSLRQQRRL